MSDFCKICLAEAIDLDNWFLKTKQSHGKTAIIECICPWCIEDIIPKIKRYDMLQERYSDQNPKHFDELCSVYFDMEKI